MCILNINTFTKCTKILSDKYDVIHGMYGKEHLHTSTPGLLILEAHGTDVPGSSPITVP